MLPADHPLRQQRVVFQGQSFVFRNNETRDTPALKTTQRLLHLDILRRRNGVVHYLGQKGLPMFASLQGHVLLLVVSFGVVVDDHCFTTGWKYSKFNLLEWMHNMGRTFDCILNLLFGLVPPPPPYFTLNQIC